MAGRNIPTKNHDGIRGIDINGSTTPNGHGDLAELETTDDPNNAIQNDGTMQNLDDADNSEDESLPTINHANNPDIVEDQEEDQLEKKLRGDAIGDTLYSERFVLGVLMRLNELKTDLSETEQYEKELCDLWDMTTHEDVVLFLLDHDVVDLFVPYIQESKDRRLVEILVGILGNMCAVAQTVGAITANSDAIAALLQLAECVDTPTLIQLMRLYSAMFRQMNQEQLKVWFPSMRYQYLNYANLLENSLNKELLASVFTALNTILAVFECMESLPNASLPGMSTFQEAFVQPRLVKATLTGFESMSFEPKQVFKDPQMQRVVQSFLHIHGILSQYEEESMAAYTPYMMELLKSLDEILRYLLPPRLVIQPFKGDFHRVIITEITHIVLFLQDPIFPPLMVDVLLAWHKLTKDPVYVDSPLSASNILDEYEEACSWLFDMLERQVTKAKEEDLVAVVKDPRLPSNILQHFISDLDTRALKICHDKLSKASKS